MITGGLCGAPASPGATRTPRSWLGERARLLVPFMLVVGLLSCGTGAAGPESAAIRCPARAPATGQDQAGGPAALPLFRPAPVCAVICPYAPGLPSPYRLVSTTPPLQSP